MATRRRLRRPILLYEFAGIDHRDRQLWRLRAVAATWTEATEMVRAGRRGAPLAPEPATPEILRLPELLADAGG